MASVGGEGGDSLALNIMPMLDIFSILILFLLMNFSSDPVNHDVTAGLEIPLSMTFTSLDAIPMITVLKEHLLYDGNKIADIDPGTEDFTKESRRGGQGGLLLLYEELSELRKSQQKRSSVLDDGLAGIDGEERDTEVESLTLEVDKSLNFIILKRIMLSAQQAEFIAFKLMVEKPGE